VAEGHGADRTAIFLHIGKTAGWTLRQILYRNVPRRQVMRVRPPMQRPRGFLNDEPLRTFAALPEAERARPRLLVSHMIFGIHEFVPGESTYFTMLREPVARALSQYRHVLRRPEHRLHAAAAAGDSQIDAWRRGDAGRRVRPSRSGERTVAAEYCVMRRRTKLENRK